MGRKKLLWICPGNIAPNCAGKVGDVLLTSAITYYLQKNWEIHFITNQIMSKRLQNTYKISVSEIKETGKGLRIDRKDLIEARDADCIFILRPFGDNEGNVWQSQLIIDYKIDRKKIFRIGNLNAFSLNAHLMATQIFNEIGHQSEQNGLDELAGLKEVDDNFVEGKVFPLLDVSKYISRSDFKKDQYKKYLILPFAGGRQKWLPTELVVELILKLDKLGGVIEIAGTPFGDDKEGLLEIKKELQKKIGKKGCKLPKVSYQCKSLEEIVILSKDCEHIFCVDGGICWVTIAGLNWCASQENWEKIQYPKISVILGRDKAWNLAPTASVWKPLAKFPNRINQINLSQELRLVDIADKMKITKNGCMRLTNK